MSKRYGRQGAWLPGLVLIAIGAWFLLDAIGVAVPGMAAMWPIFPTLVGIGLFGSFLLSDDPRKSYGVAIPATINFLIGIFFFAFTLGILSWDRMGVLWPVFPLIVGLAFYAAWVLSLFRAWEMLIPGTIVGAVGVVGLAFTLAGEESLVAQVLGRGWPVLLILLGLVFLVQGFARRGRGDRPAVSNTPPNVERPQAEERPAYEGDLEPFAGSEKGDDAPPGAEAQEYRYKGPE